jgi:hypothetical protein
MRLHSDWVRRFFRGAIPRRITCVAVVAFVAALLSTGSALAREVQVVPIDFVGEPLCSTELVHVTGTILVTIAETTDANGVTHGTLATRWVNASAVNLVTGATYRVIESDHSVLKVNADGQLSMSTANALLIASDGSTSTMVHIQFMFLLDADGNYTYRIDNLRITCFG